ncbi:MAG: response regulator transcription factor [Pseudomonadota bacterium]
MLVEDDLELQQLIRRYLEKNGFDVDVCSDGADAVDRIVCGDFDLVILDLKLPGLDGISVCREIRHRFFGPVLMLTASGDDIDHVVGLEVGADDFILKPVEPRVLLARIRARLRAPAVTRNLPPAASAAPSPALLSAGGLTINLSSRVAEFDGRTLELSTPEYDLLVLLAENAGQVLSREAIFQSLRKLPYDGQNRFVDVTVSQIRKQLGDQAEHHLKTVRGKGYLLALSR